ncbi:MAG: hypothetical protein LLG01_09270 [Planctomycetaceae bacterium]|nr:hypothetical protein [Planctomycetaceae bacterium]
MKSAWIIVLTIAPALLGAAVVLAQSAPSPAPATRPTVLKRMAPYRMKEFIIGSWPFHSDYDENFCRRYKAAGFNTLIDSPAILDLAEKTGLKVIIHTALHPVMDKASGQFTGKFDMGGYAHLPEIQWFHKMYGKKPALIGHLVNDNCTLHDYTIEVCRWMRANCSEQIPFMSHNPDAGGQAKVVDALPILSSQNYPYGYHNEWSESKKRLEFCKRLEEDRRHANANDMVIWPIFAVYGGAGGDDRGHGAKPCDLSPSQIRFQAFSSLAYGAQSLWYFAYSSKRPVWKDGGSVRTAVTYCNNYIVPMVGPRVLGTRCVGVFHSKGADDAPDGSPPLAEDRIVESMDKNLLAGVLMGEEDFAAGKSTPAYVLVVDKRTVQAGQGDPPARQASVSFGPQVRKVTILGDKARTGSVNGNLATLNLVGGDGVLLRLE